MKRFSLKVLILTSSSVVSARLLVLLSSISRAISLQLVPAGSLNDQSDIPFSSNDFELLILDMNCLAERAKLKDLAGALAEKIILLSDEEQNERVILDFTPGQASHLRTPLTYHNVADAFGQVGINLRKLNCWEYKQCGRGLGQAEESGLESCPVGKEEMTSGMNEGTMGGRVCWAIGGSFCAGELQGTFASKIMSCQECDFYKLVHEEQGQYSESINSILGRMKRKEKG